MFNFSRKKETIKEIEEVPQRSEEEIEIERDYKITEFSYVLYGYGMDYLIPYLYEWNIENLDNIITIDELHSRNNWITLCHLNGLYTDKDLEIDNENLKKHDLVVDLPTVSEILKYRMRRDDGKPRNE